MKLVVTFDIHQSDEALSAGQAVNAQQLAQITVDRATLLPLVTGIEKRYGAVTGKDIMLVRAEVSVDAGPVYGPIMEKLYGGREL